MSGSSRSPVSLYAACHPEEVLDIGIVIAADENSVTFVHKDVRLTVPLGICQTVVRAGSWIAYRKDKNSGTPSEVWSCPDEMETTVKDGSSIRINCRAAIPEDFAVYHTAFDVPKQNYVWSPEFEWLYDPMERLCERRGCRPHYLYQVEIRPLKQPQPVERLRRPTVCNFELVEVIGESNGNQLDLVMAPWIRDTPSASIAYDSMNALQARDDPTKYNFNTWYTGLVVRGSTDNNVSRQSWSAQQRGGAPNYRTEVFVWARLAGLHRISRQYMYDSNTRCDVGQWVKFRLKSNRPNEAPEAMRITAATAEPRETRIGFDDRNRSVAEALVEVQLPEQRSEIEARDEALGNVGLRGLEGKLRDHGYSVDEIREGGNLVRFWARFTNRRANMCWEFQELHDNPICEAPIDKLPAVMRDLLTLE